MRYPGTNVLMCVHVLVAHSHHTHQFKGCRSYYVVLAPTGCFHVSNTRCNNCNVVNILWLYKYTFLQIIIHLMEELDARKQPVKSQCLDNLRRLLEAQVEGLSAALADRKQALTERAKQLQQKITDRCTWMAQASSFQ